MANDEELVVQVDLHYDFSLRSLRAAIRNSEDRDLFITSPLQSYRDSDPKLDRGLYYAYSLDGALNLAKRLWPIPDGLMVYRPEVPLLTRIAAGETFIDDMMLPLAMQPYYPYMDLMDTPPVPFSPTVERISFSIGVIDATAEALQLKPVGELSQGSFPVYRASYGALAEHQVIIYRAIDVQVKMHP